MKKYTLKLISIAVVGCSLSNGYCVDNGVDNAKKNAKNIETQYNKFTQEIGLMTQSEEQKLEKKSRQNSINFFGSLIYGLNAFDLYDSNHFDGIIKAELAKIKTLIFNECDHSSFRENGYQIGAIYFNLHQHELYSIFPNTSTVGRHQMLYNVVKCLSKTYSEIIEGVVPVKATHHHDHKDNLYIRLLIDTTHIVNGEFLNNNDHKLVHRKSYAELMRLSDTSIKDINLESFTNAAKKNNDRNSQAWYESYKREHGNGEWSFKFPEITEEMVTRCLNIALELEKFAEVVKKEIIKLGTQK